MLNKLSKTSTVAFTFLVLLSGCGGQTPRTPDLSTAPSAVETSATPISKPTPTPTPTVEAPVVEVAYSMVVSDGLEAVITFFTRDDYVSVQRTDTILTYSKLGMSREQVEPIVANLQSQFAAKADG